MYRRSITAIALIAVTMTGAIAAADRKPRSASVSVTLPEGADAFSGGERSEAINNSCLACHSKEMILTQPKLSRTAWTEEVMKMRKVYGAPVKDRDVPAIVAYLESLRP